jgi:hypothetical protein
MFTKMTPLETRIERLALSRKLREAGLPFKALLVLTDDNYCPHAFMTGFECDDCGRDVS